MKMLFKAINKKTGEKFWFDLLWGDETGHIGVVPYGEPLTKTRYKDNIYLIDPANYDISLINDNTILDRLYDSEINFEISTLWDAGFTVKYGDSMNGYKEVKNCMTFQQAIDLLVEMALKYSPNSKFSRTYKRRKDER